jgi:hypothetical protein
MGCSTRWLHWLHCSIETQQEQPPDVVCPSALGAMGCSTRWLHQFNSTAIWQARWGGRGHGGAPSGIVCQVCGKDGHPVSMICSISTKAVLRVVAEPHRGETRHCPLLLTKDNEQAYKSLKKKRQVQ